MLEKKYNNKEVEKGKYKKWLEKAILKVGTILKKHIQ